MNGGTFQFLKDIYELPSADNIVPRISFGEGADFPILGTTLRWIDSTPMSRILTRCTKDVDAVDGWFATLFIFLSACHSDPAKDGS